MPTPSSPLGNPGASLEAIQDHYDVSNDFYRLWLDSNMLYSGAMWEADDTLETAQQFTGVVPGPIAFMPWQQPWDPLFANVSYTYQPASEGPLGPVDAAIGPAPIACTPPSTCRISPVTNGAFSR